MQGLEQVIMRGFESKTLDYKGPCKWDETDKKACCELVKDVLAMSNAGGGYLVIGVAEMQRGFEYVGLSADQIKSFETSRFNRFVQNYTDPPINCTIGRVTIDSSDFIAIEIPGFVETPHLCQKDYPGVLQHCGLYIRTDNNESALIKSSSDFRKIIERAVRNKQDTLLESFRAILTNSSQAAADAGQSDQFCKELEAAWEAGAVATMYQDEFGGSRYTGYREFWAYPSKYLGRRFDLQQLHAAAEKAGIEFRGWPFLFYGRRQDIAPYAIEDGIEAKLLHTDFANQDRADFWQFKESGLFYQRVLMWEESCGGTVPNPPLLDYREVAVYAAEGLYAMTKLYEDLLDVAELVTVGVRILGTEGRCLFTNSGAFSSSYLARIPSVSFEKTAALADWRAGLIDHALEITNFILQKFNWRSPNLGACRDAIEKTFSRRL